MTDLIILMLHHVAVILVFIHNDSVKQY